MLLLIIWGVRYLTMSDSERVTQVAHDYCAALLAQNYSAVYARYDEATIHLTPERDCIAGAQRFDERRGVVRNGDVLADSAVLLPNTGQAQAVITVRVTRTAPSSLQVFLINDSDNIRLPDWKIERFAALTTDACPVVVDPPRDSNANPACG
jgi:hypothetical protein